MTFYEAALRVLESAGRPLHFQEITEKSIAQNLLSHVGKTPEQTMLSRLAAMARRTRDRKVIVTAKDTFGLADWSVPEDPEALAQTGVPEQHPEAELPPLRPVERHPEPRQENVRSVGRGERKRHREDDEGRGRKRRFPPVAEVVFELLSDSAGPLKPEELLESARGRELASDELTTEQMLTALLEDNQRRIDAGRRPQFLFSQESGQVALERAGAPSEAPPLELQAAFAAALGIPLEGGRPVLSKGAAGVEAPEGGLFAAAKTAVKEARRAAARTLRRRLAESDVGTFEKACVRMLQGLGFRELKVAKRSKEGPLFTSRKREGSVELRYAIRLLKGQPSVDRRTVQEVRRDMGHYGAQVGLLLCAGDVRGDARGEAQSSGPLAMLWCGDALGDKFLEAEAGVTVTQLVLYELDERFFDVARLDAEESARRREERKSEKRAQEGEGREGQEEVAKAWEEVEPRAEEPIAASAEPGAGGEEEGEEGEEDEALEAASAFAAGEEGAAGGPGQQGERKRRRRRRRGRRGRRQGEGPAQAAGPQGEAGGAGPEAGAESPRAEGEAVAAVEASPPDAERGAPTTEPRAPSAPKEAETSSEPRSSPGAGSAPESAAPPNASGEG